jgi:hypothetical protein
VRGPAAGRFKIFFTATRINVVWPHARATHTLAAIR